MFAHQFRNTKKKEMTKREVVIFFIVGMLLLTAPTLIAIAKAMSASH